MQFPGAKSAPSALGLGHFKSFGLSYILMDSDGFGPLPAREQADSATEMCQPKVRTGGL